MTETITINGKKFNLNVRRAKELGVLEEAPTPPTLLRVTDLDNGDVFQWKFDRTNAIWEEPTLVMLDKNMRKNGQALCFIDGIPSHTWFRIPDATVLIRKWDFNTNMFVEIAAK